MHLFYVLRRFRPFHISQHHVSIKGLKQANMDVHVNSSWAFRPMRSIKVSKTGQNLGIRQAWIREKAGKVPGALTMFRFQSTYVLLAYNIQPTLHCSVYLMSTYGLQTLLQATFISAVFGMSHQPLVSLISGYICKYVLFTLYRSVSVRAFVQILCLNLLVGCSILGTSLSACLRL